MTIERKTLGVSRVEGIKGDVRQGFALTGSRYYTSGLYTPGTVMLQPAGYIRDFAADFRRRHIGLGSDWQVRTPKANVTTPKIILATNGHLESFGYQRGRLMHVMLYASMSPELDADELRVLGGASRWGVTGKTSSP